MVMPGIIDADTHVAESHAMWEHIEKEFYPRRPVLVTVPDDTWYTINNAFWLIDGNIFPKPAGRGSFSLITPSEAKRQIARGDIHRGCREMTDIKTRLADMDRLEVETQVVYPTLFLIYLTPDAGLEAALCRAYNRFMASACEQSGGRMRWVIVPPLGSVEETVKEIMWGKEHGAVGVFFRGIEGDKTLDNPYFFPVYAEAETLGLPVCVHTGAGAPTLTALFDIARNHTLGHIRILPLLGFRDLVANKIPEMFPRLSFGFIEAAASWVPFLIHVLRRLFRDKFKFASSRDLFSEYRMFVACEADEDIPYLANFIGEDHLLIGSDYGHLDPSEERQLVATMRAREDMPAGLVEAILKDNPKRFYPL
jgi:uncharacterized protein